MICSCCLSFQVASLHEAKRKAWSCSVFVVFCASALSHQFFIRFLFPIRCQPRWTKVRQTNNKLGKGATNISAKTCFSASHSLVPTPFSTLGISGLFFFQDNSETKLRDNPANYVLYVCPSHSNCENSTKNNSVTIYCIFKQSVFFTLNADCLQQIIQTHIRLIISLQTHIAAFCSYNWKLLPDFLLINATSWSSGLLSHDKALIASHMWLM